MDRWLAQHPLILLKGKRGQTQSQETLSALLPPASPTLHVLVKIPSVSSVL